MGRMVSKVGLSNELVVGHLGSPDADVGGLSGRTKGGTGPEGVAVYGE